MQVFTSISGIVILSKFLILYNVLFVREFHVNLI